MSQTAILLGVFGLGLVSGYLLRGATRISMSADEVAWGWGYKRRHRRRSRRDVRVRGSGATAAVLEGNPATGTETQTGSNSSHRRLSRWLFLSGLATGAAFATAYLMLDTHLDAVDWIGISLVNAMPIFTRLPHWAG